MSTFADMTSDHVFQSRTEGCGAVIRHLRETNSTNQDARAWALDGAPDGAVVIADHQRAGRGRFKRTWVSAPGKNLLLTLVIRRTLPRPALLPLAIGVGVCNTVRSFLPWSSAGLKWPNDVRIDGRKVAGILVESPGPGVYLAGIGLNVNQVDFPEDLATEPTSLMLETADRLRRADVFDRLMDALDDALDMLERGDLLPAYRSLLEGRGAEVQLEDGRRGVMKDVDASGGLVLEIGTGVIVVHSGDVSLRPPPA